MDFPTLILALSPVIVLLLCGLIFRLPGYISCLAGLVCALIVSTTFFKTSTHIAAGTMIHSAFYGLPFVMFIAVGLLLAGFLKTSGALESFSKRWWVIPGKKSASQIILLNIGIPSVLMSLGINPVFILPSLLILLGYSAYAAIALPLVGTSILWLYAGWGDGIDLFALHLGGAQTMGQAGFFPVIYLGPAVFVICICLCYLAGGAGWIRKGIIPSLLAAIVFHLCAILASKLELTSATGFISGIGLSVALYLLNCFSPRGDKSEGQPLGSSVPEIKITYLFPIVITSLLFMVTRFITPIREFTFETASMTLNILPGQIIHLRPLAMPWFWMLLGSLVSIGCYRGESVHVGSIISGWIRSSWRPVLGGFACAATAGVMWYSGREIFIAEGQYRALILPDGNPNMINVMMDNAAILFQRFYALPGVAMGTKMGFISGNPYMPVAILTRYQIEIATELIKPGGAGTFIAAGSALAGAVGIMVNPAWLQATALTIGENKLDSRVMRSTMTSAILITFVLIVIALILSMQ